MKEKTNKVEEPTEIETPPKEEKMEAELLVECTEDPSSLPIDLKSKEGNPEKDNSFETKEEKPQDAKVMFVIVTIKNKGRVDINGDTQFVVEIYKNSKDEKDENTLPFKRQKMALEEAVEKYMLKSKTNVQDGTDLKLPLKPNETGIIRFHIGFKNAGKHRLIVKLVEPSTSKEKGETIGEMKVNLFGSKPSISTEKPPVDKEKNIQDKVQRTKKLLFVGTFLLALPLLII